MDGLSRIDELQEKFNENPRRYFAPLANEYRKAGNAKRAIEICRAHLAQLPGHMSGQIVYGQSLFEGGEYEEARKVFERALVLDPENRIALRSLGDLSLQAGNTLEARGWYTRVLDTDPKDVAVIALVSEIDALLDSSPTPAQENIPGIDPDRGDQQLPVVREAETAGPAAVESASTGYLPETGSPYREETSREETSAKESDTGDGGGTTEKSKTDFATPPAGLVLHYPVEPPIEDDDEMLMDPIITDDRYTTAELEEPIEEEPKHDEPVLEEPVEDEQEGEEPVEHTVANAAPFVNETMAQLYLQQGYRQLALKVYRQLLESRPADRSLKDRIAEIESAEPSETRSPHPAPVTARVAVNSDFPMSSYSTPRTVPVFRKEEPPSVETPVTEPAVPREPSTESPSRKPSIREFFATLGRRRPPRRTPVAMDQASSVEQPESAPSAAAPPSVALDAVFAGASVSAADSRAASALAGAFSGSARGSNPPPLSSTPTPRMNQRVAHSQESEEDVARFRAWLDGLTGE